MTKLKFLYLALSFVLVFVLVWFAHSGFYPDILSLSEVLIFTLFIFIYPKIGFNNTFWLIVILFAASVLLEIATLSQFAQLAASMGYGVLIILVLFEIFKRIKIPKK